MSIGTGYFHRALDVPSGWFHLALVFHGPEHGFIVYKDNTSLTDSILTTGDDASTRNSSGVVVLDRAIEDRSRNYGSFSLDELTFWNRQLTETEVEKLRNMY